MTKWGLLAWGCCPLVGVASADGMDLSVLSPSDRAALAEAAATLTQQRHVSVQGTRFERFESIALYMEVSPEDNEAEVVLRLEADGGFSRLNVLDPQGRVVLDVSRAEGLLGLHELSIETEEPDVAAAREAFPAGHYTVAAVDPNSGRGWLARTALDHGLPDAPDPAVAVGPTHVTITWVPDPALSHYQLEIELEDDQAFMDQRLPASQGSQRLPIDWFAAGREYEVSLMAVAHNGNGVVAELEFEVDD